MGRETNASPPPSDDSGSEDEYKVPVELKSEFIAAVIGRQYSDALQLCDYMLKYDPDSELANQYRPLLALAVEEQEDESSSEESSDESSEEESSEESDSSDSEPSRPSSGVSR